MRERSFNLVGVLEPAAAPALLAVGMLRLLRTARREAVRV